MTDDVVIIANKWWEAAPLVSVLLHPDASPATILNRALISRPRVGAVESTDPTPTPRLRLTVEEVPISIWCLQELMRSRDQEHPSSTWEKARVLPKIFSWTPRPRLVIAFGTAADPDGTHGNGAVVLGCDVFVHDPFESPPNPERHWVHADFDRIVPSDAAPLLEALTDVWAGEVTKRALPPPNGAAIPLTPYATTSGVSVGVVNVTDYRDYDWTDERALERFRQLPGSRFAACVETTHGVVRLASPAPFMFVSGFANQVGRYQDQAAPNLYAQNFAAAHNAALALAWTLPEICRGL